MKILALLTMVGVSPTLRAQTSVVPYGYFDLGIAKESGSGARLDRGYNNWLGLNGEEKLTTGIVATFNLETRFNLDTGEQERPHTYWQGESTVGLKGDHFGRLRLGRALTPLWQTVWEYEPWMNSGFNASLAAYQTGSYSSDGIHDTTLGFADFSRISDGVFYSTPEFYGFTAHAAIKLEDDPAADDRPAGMAISYTGGPLRAVFAYEKNAHRDNIQLLGARYRLGTVELMASYARNCQPGETAERTFVLAGIYRFDNHTIRVGYGRNQRNDNDKISTGYVYAFSSRVTLYVDLYREQPEDGNGIALGVTQSF